MLDNETYQQEVIRMWDSLRKNYKGYKSCVGVPCGDCPLHEIEYGCEHGLENPLSVVETYNIVEKWSKEHQPKKFKVSQLEHDILKIYIDLGYYGTFNGYVILSEIFKKGYFAGATSKTNIRDYFNNCEVVDE